MSVLGIPLVPQGPIGTMEWGLQAFTKRFTSSWNGVTQTLGQGSHVQQWVARLTYENLSASNRGRMEAFLAGQRGGGARFILPHYLKTLRGSFPATELFTNTDFEGTTGWAAGAEYVLSAADGILRATRDQMTGGGSAAVQSLALTQFLPYAVRALTVGGRGSHTTIGPIITGIATNFGTPGYASAAGVPLSTGSVLVGAHDNHSSGLMAGDYFSIPFMSAARCALVDNGQNLLLQSDELDTSWTATRSSVDDQATAAPDGTVTADSIIEDATASDSHFVSQAVTVAATALDYAFSCALKAGARTWAFLQVSESAGGDAMRAWVNLSTGAIGTVTTTGSGWTNVRGYVADLGNGWYKLSVVGRKASAGTTLTALIALSTGDAVTAYSGNGTSNVYAWRATLAQASVPTRLVQTTTTATSGSSQTGSALHVRGLPVSTAGLLLPGDPFEIVTSAGSELKRVTWPLDSDAAGVGYLQFEPGIRTSPSEGAAVIVCRPVAKMMLVEPTVRWIEKRAGRADLDFMAIEDLAA